MTVPPIAVLLGAQQVWHNLWLVACPNHPDDDFMPALIIEQCENGTIALHCFGRERDPQNILRGITLNYWNVSGCISLAPPRDGGIVLN
jgi:hypothetical protein